jgi:hypothetical protein
MEGIINISKGEFFRATTKGVEMVGKVLSTYFGDGRTTNTSSK